MWERGGEQYYLLIMHVHVVKEVQRVKKKEESETGRKGKRLCDRERGGKERGESEMNRPGCAWFH